MEDHFQVGDRVLYLNQNYFSTRTTLPAKRCGNIPESMSWEDAATMPCVYATVIHSFIDGGRLIKGQSVLIHSACGGIGLSAIQICQNVVGAKVIFFLSVNVLSFLARANNLRYTAHSATKKRSSIS